MVATSLLTNLLILKEWLYNHHWVSLSNPLLSQIGTTCTDGKNISPPQQNSQYHTWISFKNNILSFLTIFVDKTQLNHSWTHYNFSWAMLRNWLWTPQNSPISELLLTRFWPNFKGCFQSGLRNTDGLVAHRQATSF